MKMSCRFRSEPFKALLRFRDRSFDVANVAGPAALAISTPMKKWAQWVASALMVFCTWDGTAVVTHANSVVVEESFATGNANWRTGGFTPPTIVPAGGPDGNGYISQATSFQSLGQGTLFRGHQSLNASNGAFAGNWIGLGYTELSAWVRHNASIPLTYFVRIAKPSNFPAATAQSSVLVPPNVWTPLHWDVRPGSPQITAFEGSDHTTIFSGIGNLQVAVNTPAELKQSTVPYTFDLDDISLSVPEAGSLGMAVMGVLFVAVRRRSTF